MLQIIEALRTLAQLNPRVQLLQPTRQPRRTILLSLELAAERGREAACEAQDVAQPLAGIRHGELGRAGRRRRAHVGDEIRDREIDFVPDAGDDRDRASVDRTRDALRR